MDRAVSKQNWRHLRNSFVELGAVVDRGESNLELSWTKLSQISICCGQSRVKLVQLSAVLGRHRGQRQVKLSAVLDIAESNSALKLRQIIPCT